MSEKSKIAAVLGEQALLLPDLVARALAANDRLKFILSWLQAAAAAADTPDAPRPDLSRERRAAGIADARFDEALRSVRKAGSGYRLAGASALPRQLTEELDAMMAPLGTGAAAFIARREELLAAVGIADDIVPAALLPALTLARRDGPDSIHLLVMDLHKAINQLQAGLAEERIDGARAYRLAEPDRAVVAAFMRGVNRTAPLVFGHPGLATTATRAGDRLIIQNDIGTTDAHVIVIHVEGRLLTVTYTDVHARRLRFFQDRLRDFPVDWSQTRTHRATGLEEEEFYMTVGSLQAADESVLQQALEALGAGLAFLIDWNKARKSLRPFVSKGDAIALLDWAADNGFGHRAYLVLGGERLLFDAIEAVRRTGAGGGERLGELIGEPAALEFLRNVLQTASEGLRAGRSAGAIADIVRADLIARMESVFDRMLDLTCDHAALTLDMANLVHEALVRAGSETPALNTLRARRAKTWESDADRLVMRVRHLAEGLPDGALWRRAVDALEDAADALEDAMFHLGLVYGSDSSPSRDPLLRLSALVVSAIQDCIRAFHAVRHLHRVQDRTDIRVLLECVERLRSMEHASDEAEREVIAAAVDGDPRRLFVVTAVAHHLEEAGDHLLRTGLTLSDLALAERLRG